MMKFPGRRRLWSVLVFILCLFLVYTATGERGLVSLSRMESQRDELRFRVDALEGSNAELAEQVSLLRDDPATIENLARTELGMVREGETVFIISDRAGDQPE